MYYEEVLMRMQMDVAPGKQSDVSSEEEGDYDEEDYESEEDNSNQQLMMNLINKKSVQADSVAMNWEQILDVLNKQLPEIPAKPVV